MDKSNDSFGLLLKWQDDIYEEALQMTCDRRIGPYPCCSVVEGDCLELMKALPDGCVDAVITDPPYGMDNNCDYRRFSGGNTGRGPGVKHSQIIGDDAPFNPLPWLVFPKCILWGANHYWSRLPAAGCLIWVKRNTEAFGTFLSDAEIAFISGIQGVYCFEHVFAGSMRAIEAGNGVYGHSAHPAQKPIELMQWCIERAGNPQTILDPFAGSGTTLVAAKKLGRHFLGFEISPEYCEIARDRLARIDAQPSLFEVEPEQLKLEENYGQ